MSPDRAPGAALRPALEAMVEAADWMVSPLPGTA